MVMRQRFLLSICGVGLGVLALLLTSLPATGGGTQFAAGGWEIQCIDCPKSFDVMTSRSLRLAADDRPAVAYGGDQLYFAWYDGVVWQHSIVDAAANVGASASLALDTAGEAHIAYYDGLNHDLKYARWTPSGWTRQVVDGAGDAGASAALALDRANRPHIAYYANDGDQTGFQLKYARWTGVQWEISKVEDTTSVLQDIALALDSADRPHISYHYYQNQDLQDLRYARWTGSQWEFSTVESVGQVGTGNSLVLDRADRPHISYYDYDSLRGALHYATWDGSAWRIQIVDEAGDVGGYTSIALDHADWPVISYHDYTNGDLKLARLTGGSTSAAAALWQIETVDSAGDVGVYTSLALGSADQAHIVYLDLTASAIQYAHWTGAQWLKLEVDRAGRVGDYSSLTLDAVGNLHVSYHDIQREQLKYAARTNGEWYTTVVDSTPGAGLYTALALDASAAPHISYQGGPSLGLKYAYWTGDAWAIQTVDATAETGSRTAISVDGLGRPHISYYDVISQTLKYATLAGAVWVREAVDVAGAMSFTAMALDRAGTPHIAYYASSPETAMGVLRYAHRTPTGWQSETVDDSGDVGAYLALALDGADVPHISYYDFTAGRVKYARRDGAAWVTQIVAVTGGDSYTSLAVDPAGVPHIAFYDGGAANLKYASPASAAASGWVIETVQQGGDVGQYPSLTLDAHGHPNISYYDATNGDLLWAYEPGGPGKTFLPLVLSQRGQSSLGSARP